VIDADDEHDVTLAGMRGELLGHAQERRHPDAAAEPQPLARAVRAEPQAAVRAVHQGARLVVVDDALYHPRRRALGLDDHAELRAAGRAGDRVRVRPEAALDLDAVVDQVDVGELSGLVAQRLAHGLQAQLDRVGGGVMLGADHAVLELGLGHAPEHGDVHDRGDPGDEQDHQVDAQRRDLERVERLAGDREADPRDDERRAEEQVRVAPGRTAGARTASAPAPARS